MRTKSALTFEEYKKIHPRTRKNRNDPLFSKSSPTKSKSALPPAKVDREKGEINIDIDENTRLYSNMLGENFGWWMGSGDEEKGREIEESLPYTNVIALEGVTVDPKHQGKGLGSQMMKSFIQSARKEGHDCIVTNASPLPVGNEMKDMSKLNDLIRFYSSFGFKIHEKSEGNAVMILDLEEKPKKVKAALEILAAIDFNEYKKKHPKTKKTQSDPMFEGSGVSQDEKGQIKIKHPLDLDQATKMLSHVTHLHGKAEEAHTKEPSFENAMKYQHAHRQLGKAMGLAKKHLDHAKKKI